MYDEQGEQSTLKQVNAKKRIVIDNMLEMSCFSIYCQIAKVQNTAYSGSFSVTKPLTVQLPNGNR